jgi:hypothetical protein
VGGKIRISADITNSSNRAGDEVVQLYTQQFAAPPRPIRELKGFERVSLMPGEKKRVTFTLHANQLGVYDEELQFAIYPGSIGQIGEIVPDETGSSMLLLINKSKARIDEDYGNLPQS